MSLFENDHFEFNEPHFHISNGESPFTNSPQDVNKYFPTEKMVKTMSYSQNTFTHSEDITGLFQISNQPACSSFGGQKPVPNLDSLFTKQIIRNIGSIKDNRITPGLDSQTPRTGDLMIRVLQPEKLNISSRIPLTDCTNNLVAYPSSLSSNIQRKISDAIFPENTDLTDHFENDVFISQSLPDMVNDSRDKFRRIQSEPIINDLYAFSSIKPARNRFLQNSSNMLLIGDLTRPHTLPIVSPGNDGVVFITSQTLSDLLEDRAAFSKKDVMIVDCRYPYEYSGGHINGSLNLYTKESLLKYFLSNKENPRLKSIKAIIFHCEFSKQRGPLLARLLRNKDRAFNLTRYPKLFYPEVYVLYGGYRDFYQSYPNLCCPSSYIQMSDSRYIIEYAKYKRESKSSMSEEPAGSTILNI